MDQKRFAFAPQTLDPRSQAQIHNFIVPIVALSSVPQRGGCAAPGRLITLPLAALSAAVNALPDQCAGECIADCLIPAATEPSVEISI